MRCASLIKGVPRGDALQVGFNHQAAQLRNLRGGLPAEHAFGFRAATLQEIHRPDDGISGLILTTHFPVFWSMPRSSGPVPCQVKSIPAAAADWATKSRTVVLCPVERTYTSGVSRCNSPHALDVFRSIPPVALRIEVAQFDDFQLPSFKRATASVIFESRTPFHAAETHG